MLACLRVELMCAPCVFCGLSKACDCLFGWSSDLAPRHEPVSYQVALVDAASEAVERALDPTRPRGRWSLAQRLQKRLTAPTEPLVAILHLYDRAAERRDPDH